MLVSAARFLACWTTPLSRSVVKCMPANSDLSGPHSMFGNAKGWWLSGRQMTFRSVDMLSPTHQKTIPPVDGNMRVHPLEAACSVPGLYHAVPGRPWFGIMADMTRTLLVSKMQGALVRQADVVIPSQGHIRPA